MQRFAVGCPVTASVVIMSFFIGYSPTSPVEYMLLNREFSLAE
jgi:hypothetical protein